MGRTLNGHIKYRCSRYVVTYHPRFRRSVLSEIRNIHSLWSPIAYPDSGTMIVANGTPGHDLAQAFQVEVPTFIQHLAPVQVQIQLDGTSEDLDRLLAVVDGLNTLDIKRSFAVQCRKGRQTVSGPHSVAAYSVKDVEVRIGSYLEENGFIVNFDAPEQAVSIYLHGQYASIGISKVSENISCHADEYRRRGAQAPDISRAEHKLLEAFELFDITVFPGMHALDLGAAPGGWTKALIDAGAEVTAVDPANLSPFLAAHPKLTHLRSRIEYLSFPPTSFDIIVNDMNIEPEESVVFMCSLAKCLAPGAPAVMTIKLPVMSPKIYILKAKKVLEYAYDVIAIRHLFHNRQEVTAYLKRREVVRAGWENYYVTYYVTSDFTEGDFLP